MRTKASIAFSLVDVTAKSDSTPSALDKQSFVDLAELKGEVFIPKKFATFERDFFILDGTFELFPDSPALENFGLWSLSMSDVNGSFTAPVVLTIDFTENHSSLGLTFTFHEATNDYCNSLNVKWYDLSDVLISEKNFTPNRPVYFADNMVENYQRIVITFNSTNTPFRYLKLSQLEFGQIKIFDSSDLISANILEEIDPISARVSINTLDFTMHSKNSEFSIINPTGIYTLLQQRQPLTAYEYLDGIKKNMGTFYLDDWQNDTESTITMKAIDIVGVIDGTDFKGGIYSGVTAGTIIEAIMTSADAKYELDSNLASISLSGHIPICTHREALQQVAFAIGAIVDCSRSDKIKIYPAPTLSTSTIQYSRKLYGHKVNLKPLVTGIEVTAHNYVASTDVISLYNGTLSAGTHEIIFSQPAHTLSITGATITSSGANYAILNVATLGTVTLTGKRYNDNTKIFGVYNTNLAAGEKINVKSIKKATLVSNSNAAAIAQSVYDYYQKRHQDNGPIILSNEECGDLITLDSLYAQQIQGYIERLDINLTGGFVADATITGGTA